MFCSENFSFCHKFFSLSLFSPFLFFSFAVGHSALHDFHFHRALLARLCSIKPIFKDFHRNQDQVLDILVCGRADSRYNEKKLRRSEKKIRRNSSWLQFLCAFLSGGMFWHLPEILFGSLFQSFARRSTKVSSEKRYNNGRNSRSTKKSR